MIWCQGFSEPDAGSDLASLRTTAPARRRRVADHRPEDLDLLRHHGAVVLPARPHHQGRDASSRASPIFLVPMSDPAIEVRPIRYMMGPHHLNEVFFDDLRVTEADVLGTVDDGWCDRAGGAGLRAGRHRPLRPLRTAAAVLAPEVLGEQWDELPAELRGRWARMLVHCRRARLLAYRVVPLQSARPRPARRRRGIPDRGHQARPGQRRGAHGDRRDRAALTTTDDEPHGSAPRSRTTGATRSRPRCPRAASRCSAS